MAALPRKKCAISGYALDGESSSGKPCHCWAWHHADGSGLSPSEAYKIPPTISSRESVGLCTWFTVPGDADAILPTAGG